MEFVDRLKYKSDIGIYRIRNNVNNKVYVGQTGESFLRRFFFHDWKLRNNIHDNRHLQSSWNKYGGDNFSFEIVEVLNDKTQLDEREVYWICYYRENGDCYNIQDGGQPQHLYKYISADTRKKVGELNRQRMLGSKLSETTKRKMSESRIGKRVYRKNDLLTDEQAFGIKQMLIDGFSTYEIQNALHVPYRAINNILSSNSYKTVVVDGWDDFYNNRRKVKGKPIGNTHALRHNQKTEDEIAEMKKLYEKYKNYSKVAKLLNCHRNTVAKYVK